MILVQFDIFYYQFLLTLQPFQALGGTFSVHVGHNDQVFEYPFLLLNQTFLDLKPQQNLAIRVILQNQDILGKIFHLKSNDIPYRQNRSLFSTGCGFILIFYNPFMFSKTRLSHSKSNFRFSW